MTADVTGAAVSGGFIHSCLKTASSLAAGTVALVRTLIPADDLKPLAHEFRHAALASVPRVPGPKNTVQQKPGRELPEFCRDRRDDVLRFTKDTSAWPAERHPSHHHT